MKSVLSKFLPLALLFAILSVGSAVWAQAIDKLLTSTSDGRAFSVLTEKEVDALPRPEKKAYYDWRIRLEEAETKKHQARADEAGRRRVIYERLNEQGTFLSLLVNLQNTKQPEYFEVIKKMNSKSIIKLTEKYEALRKVCISLNF